MNNYCKDCVEFEYENEQEGYCPFRKIVISPYNTPCSDFYKIPPGET